MKNIDNIRSVIALIFISFMISSCGVIFIPKKQTVKIVTNNDESTVYLDKVETGKGESFEKKVKKDGVKDVVIQTPDYLEQHHVMVQDKLIIAVYPIAILDIPIYLTFDYDRKHFRKYEEVNTFEPKYKLKYKTDDEKNLFLTNIGINTDQDNYIFNNIDHSQNIDYEAEIKKHEEEKALEKKLQQEKQAKKKKKKTIVKTLDDDEVKGLNFQNTTFAEEVYETMKKTGYIDTVNEIFKDEYNTLLIGATIKEIKWNRFSTKALWNHDYSKLGIDLTWYLKNPYGEILDSIATTEYSGEYRIYSPYSSASDAKKKVEKMYQEAVNIAYNKLHDNPTFQKHIERKEPYVFEGEKLEIKKPSPASLVNEVSDAAHASVIIKRDDEGHGSGFVISEDGYVLTNYHVIAGENANKHAPIKVILSNTEEVDVEVVRYNKSKDIALLKVDREFEKSFVLSDEKTYKNLLEVYTIGAPKSVELGQSVSMGLLSNERKTDNSLLLQLNMGVNPGNSGGPLFGKDGTLHGVIKSKLVGYDTEGVSFAIASYKIGEYLNISY